MTFASNDAKLIADALNRIADASFTQAKVSRQQLKVAERMCEMQEANLATTRALESALIGNTPIPLDAVKIGASRE